MCGRCTHLCSFTGYIDTCCTNRTWSNLCVCILVCWGWWSLMVGPRWEGLRLRWWKSSKFYVPNSDYYRRMLRGSLRGWEGIRCLRRSISWNTYEIEGNARLKLFFEWADLPKTFNYLSCYISDRMLLLITRWKTPWFQAPWAETSFAAPMKQEDFTGRGFCVCGGCSFRGYKHTYINTMNFKKRM